MRCPFCGYEESKVIDSRPTDEGEKIRRRRECLEIWHRLMSHKPYVQGHEKGHENYLSQTPGHIQGVIHLHREIIIQQAQDYGREEYDAG